MPQVVPAPTKAGTFFVRVFPFHFLWVRAVCSHSPFGAGQCLRLVRPLWQVVGSPHLLLLCVRLGWAVLSFCQQP
jgi:hypothetical protein